MISNIIVITAVLTLSLNADYEKLQEHKKAYKNDLYNKPQKSILVRKETNLIEIKYYNINDMKTDLLEKKYNLILWLAIADGICVYKYTGKESINKVIFDIDKDILNIKSIKRYEKYNFSNY